jgi:hypothetical protein
MNEVSDKPDSCSHCGSNSFEQGWIASPIHTKPITYRSESDSFLFGMGGQPVRVRRCTECGHLDLFANKNT